MVGVGRLIGLQFDPPTGPSSYPDPFSHQRELCLAQGLDLRHLFRPQILIKVDHQAACCIVGNLPQRRDGRPRRGGLKRSLQPQHAFAAG